MLLPLLLLLFCLSKYLRPSKLLSIARTRFGRGIFLTFGIPFVFILDLVKEILRSLQQPLYTDTVGIDASKFADEREFHRILERLGGGLARTTGSKAHNEFIEWIENELRSIKGLKLQVDEFEILRWQTVAETPLKHAGKLTIHELEDCQLVPIAGVVPFSKPTSAQSGELLYVPRETALEAVDIRGKIILRDLPAHPIPYSMIFLPSHSRTSDLNVDLASNFDRPGLADEPLKEELIAAGKAGAAGIIILFDIESSQVESYFEPHQGVHYKIPAMFVGVDEAMLLKAEAAKGTIATMSVEAEITKASTRNIIATLPGQSPERVIFETHTDGNTYIQENGSAAILTLAQYYSQKPLSSRKRTLQFAFNTGHLHISREGTARHAEQLNQTYDDGTLALVIPIEHLGAREIEAVQRANGKPGRELKFSGRGEMMFWSVGPSPVVVQAVQEAVSRRKLDRVLVTRGLGTPDFSRAPTYNSFGGIGTYYHNLLLPTTSLISGPWSLWAPFFGKNAVDVYRFRQQTLAIGDIYLAIDGVERSEIEAGYKDYRKRRSEGVKGPANLIPREIIED